MATKRAPRTDDDIALIDNHAVMTARVVERGTKREYRALLRLRTDEATATRLRDRWGGSISQERQPNGAPRSTVLYELAGAALGTMLREALPGMERQRAVAEAIIHLRDLAEQPVASRTTAIKGKSGRTLSDETRAQLNALVADIQRLGNRRRPAT